MTLRRNPAIEVSPLKDELLLFNAASNKFFVMNASAAFLWEALSDPAGEEALAERMCTLFSGVRPEQALADVRSTVKEMVQLGLLIDEGVAGPAGD